MSTAAIPAFTRLIRFEDEDGVVQWGDLTGDPVLKDPTGTKVDVLVGSLEGGLTRTQVTKKITKVRQDCIVERYMKRRRQLTKIVLVTQLLTPAPALRSVICIGVNYKHHAEEAKVSGACIRPPSHTTC